MTDQQQLSLSEIPECPRKRPIEDVHGLSRLGDPEPSRAAAQSISGRTERLILVFLDACDGDDFTADELAAKLPNIWPDTLKTALSRLHNHKLIEDTGITRLSNRGRAMTVYRLAPSPVSSPGSRDAL